MATKQEIGEYFAKFGKEGGKTRAKNMTPEARSEGARKAASARWAKQDQTLKEMNKKLTALEKRGAAARLPKQKKT